MARSEHRIAIATILRFFFQSEIYPYLVSIKACSYILNISLDDLIAVEEDEAPSFRTSNDSAEVRSTFEKANYIFDEIIMQKKISARAYRQVEII